MKTLAEKAGQMMMAGFDGLNPPRHILAWLAEGRIGGVYLFARNIASPAQVKRLIASCREAAKTPILVGIDQEGGAVARLRGGFTESPGAMALGASGDPQRAQDVACMLGREMAALGLNWNFAPVADIARQSVNPSVGTRSIGSDPRLVCDMVGAQIRGFQRAGVAATVKHFPGLGNTIVDTHVGMARVSGSLNYLFDEDLLPFKAAIAADVGCVMLTHARYDELDSEKPATLSPRIVNGLLRGELGFAGAVCTDCMEMKAITDGYGAGEAAVLAIEAGVDMALFSHTREAQEAAYEAVCAAARSNRISESRLDESIGRIQALKRRFALNQKPPLGVVGSAAHQALAKKAARAGIALVKSGAAMPIDSLNARAAIIELPPPTASLAGDASAASAFSAYMSRRLPRAVCHVADAAGCMEESLNQLQSVARDADTLIVVTRDAHLQPAQLRLARSICARHRLVILVCARSPYDAGLLPAADTILCANGESAPSLEAAADAICGDFLPKGKLTVDIG